MLDFLCKFEVWGFMVCDEVCWKKRTRRHMKVVGKCEGDINKKERCMLGDV